MKDKFCIVELKDGREVFWADYWADQDNAKNFIHFLRIGGNTNGFIIAKLVEVERVGHANTENA